MTETITLVQPRHIYAPDPFTDQIGHVYMPTSLLVAAAGILQTGCTVSICDENLSPSCLESEIVGINLVGAPYLPRAMEYVSRLHQLHGEEFTLIVGGQVVSCLLDWQLSFLLGSNVIDGNQSALLAQTLGVEDASLRSCEALSLVPAYRLLSDEQMFLYLSNESCFYLSQGCKYACTFCAANRTRRDPSTGRIRRETERYRDIEVARTDLEYLMNRAKRLGVARLCMYLSNLDLFQTPSCLHRFAKAVLQSRANTGDLPLELRGLANVRSFLDVHRKSPEVIHDLIGAGLTRLGFGVDGATLDVWKATKKPQTQSECIEAIVVAREHYGLTPETLLVFGHNGVDTTESLGLAYEFAKAMRDEYGALPRPHVAKNVVPGNDGWYDDENGAIVRVLLEYPAAFQSLDFTAMPSPITHPDPGFLALVTEYYLKVCSLDSCLTQPVLPLKPGMSEREQGEVRSFNLGKYDI